ncbi:hypothetical protein ACJMK2_010446 [Sinanodonta woodiana]|uniref:Uncharacterized protein n=1 Tax=Sinanodonta woodiana TaxID=1069815 RepID=A0ABD3VFG4_SINWO
MDVKLAEAVSTLLSSMSSQSEVRTLCHLHCILSSAEVELSDKKEIPTFTLEFDNPYPLFSPSSLSQDQLNKFTCYIFERRFGWSETDTEKGNRVRRLSSTGTTLSAGDRQQKSILNNHFDCLIRWYLHQDLNKALLKATEYTIKKMSAMPVIRNRAVIHLMDWLKKNSDQLKDRDLFPQIQDLIVMSLTDVWSAIRNACTIRLTGLALSFDLQDVESLFTKLVNICCSESPWQAKEGAVMGMNSLMNQFQNSMNSKSPMSSPRTLEFDTEDKARNMPDFISSKIRDVTFTLLYHPQLTIREHAVKTLATFISCAGITEALSTFNKVIAVLRKGVTTNGKSFQMRSPVQYMDDYASEGFMGVCMFLVKVLPLSCLLPNWPEYMSTFILYLSHPASTVRQAASSVFRQIVVKSSHSVVMLKLILQCLAMGWSPDSQQMRAPSPQDSSPEGEFITPLRPSICDKIDCALMDTWEGREGRLFAYELIFKYLIKNHWLYTFGPAGSSLHMDNFVSQNRDMNNSIKQEDGTEARIGAEIPVSINPRDIHRVESVNILSVRFLTQVELSSLNQNPGSKNKMERMPLIDPSESGCIPDPDINQFDTTFSLLTQAQIVDSCKPENPDNDIESYRQLMQQQSVLRIMESCKLSHDDGESHSSLTWLQKEELQPMSHILKVILYQTAESLADPQWEVRRIANQVLPCLAEVIRWYKMELMEIFWRKYLTASTSLMTFTAMLTLNESLIHAVKLVPLLQKPPHSWQNHNWCKDCLSQIVNSVQNCLPVYLSHVQQLLQRPCFDKLSVIAASVIVIAHEHFHVSKGKHEQALSVLKFWKKLFYFAHSQTELAVEFPEPEDKKTFISPFQGYLSCCLVKPDSKIHCARQVEKYFVSEVYAKLPHFLDGLTCEEVGSVAPVLAHYIGIFVEDTHISKAMIECLNTQVRRMVEHMKNNTNIKDKQILLTYGSLTLKELAAVIAMKSTDSSVVQRLLGLYLELSSTVSPSTHLRHIFNAVSVRLKETLQFNVDKSPRPLFGVSSGDQLNLMSNDIPSSSSSDEEEEYDSEEEVIVGTPSSHRYAESLTLNTSNNSGRLSSLSGHSNEGRGHGGRKRSQSSQEEEKKEEETEEEENIGNDSSSDWDSWDEEDETQSAFSEVFSKFLKELQQVLHEYDIDLIAEVKKIKENEKTVILNLLRS